MSIFNFAQDIIEQLKTVDYSLKINSKQVMPRVNKRVIFNNIIREWIMDKVRTLVFTKKSIEFIIIVFENSILFLK